MSIDFKKFAESKVAPWLILLGVVTSAIGVYAFVDTKADASDVKVIEQRVNTQGERLSAVEKNEEHDDRRFDQLDAKLDKIDGKLDRLQERKR